MANQITIPSGGATSGYYTVGGTAVKPSLESGWQTAGTVDASAKTLTMTNLAGQTGIVDEAGGWTITLGGSAKAASIKAGSAVYGTTGDDTVSIGGANVYLQLGNGADSVVSAEDADKAYVDAGAGNDSISISGKQVTVYAGAGDDVVSIKGDQAYVEGGAGADSIVVDGKSSTVYGGDGNDSVYANVTSGLIDLGGGNDFASVAGDSLTVSAGDGNDSVSVGGNYVTVDGGAGNDSIVVAGNYANITAGDGADTVSIGGASVTASGGAGNDVISVQGASAVIDAGAGNDSVIVAGNDASITLGDGRDTVSIGGATGVSLQDYTYGTDVLIMGDGVGVNSTGAGAANVAFDTTGLISVNGATATIASTDGYYKARLSKTGSDDTLRYAWVSDTASTINLSSEANPFYVEADLNDTTGDSVIGGRGNDSIIVGSNDTVNGGRGNDSISIAANSTGVTVALSTSGGDDTVNGATGLTGFTADALTFYVDDASKLGFTLGGTLKASIKGASAEFTGVTGDVVDLKVNAAGTTTNYEVIASGKAAVIDENASVLYGVGDNVSVSVGAGVGNSVIDLSSHHHFDDTHTYVNINKIDATNSDGDDVLIGADTATTIAAGKGNSTIFGVGAGNDSLAGGAGNDTFFFGSGYGKDTIANYNASGDDQIVLLQASEGFTKDNSGLHMAIGNDSLTVQNVGTDAANMEYTLSTWGNDNQFTAKIGMTATANTLTYDEDVDWYIGGSKTDTLTLTDVDDHEIQLGGTWKGTTYTSIEKVDASKASGDLLIWGATNENDTILAGTGSSSIFGGFGSSGNDVLTGNTSGTTTFEFGLGCGNDTITASKAADSVYLYNVSSSDIQSTTVSGTALVLTLTDSSTLTINSFRSGSSTNTFTLTDGTMTYSTTEKKLVAAE